MRSVPLVSGSKSKESTTNLFWAFIGSLLLIFGEVRIVPSGIYTLLGWTCTIVCFWAVERADDFFSTRWAWSLDVLHYVLVKIGGVWIVLCALGAFPTRHLTLGCYVAMEGSTLMLCIYHSSWTTHVNICVWSYSI